MTEEQKARRAAQMAAWQQANREHINEVRNDWRKRKKGDPEYEANLKAERARYYAKKKQDPERYAHMLEEQHKRKQSPEYKEKDRIYRQKRAAQKLINDPEEFARQICWEEHRNYLMSVKKPQQLEFIHQYAVEHPEMYLERIKSNPVAWELYQQMQNGKETSSSTRS